MVFWFLVAEMNTTMEPVVNPEAEQAEEEDILYQKDASISAELETEPPAATTLSPNLEQKVPAKPSTQSYTESLHPIETTSGPPRPPCPLDCGPGGLCSVADGSPRCQCPLGRGGTTCELGMCFKYFSFIDKKKYECTLLL